MSICSCSVAPGDTPLLEAEVDRAPRPQRRGERQRDVLADGPLHQQRLGAIGGHVDEPCPNGIGGMAERDRGVVDKHVATRRPVGAGQDVEELVLALPLEGDDAEHLAGAKLEGDILQSCPGAEAADGQPRCRRSRAASRRSMPHGPHAPRRRCVSSPSISATMWFSDPSVTSTTPTVSPSRRTVARSHTAAISMSRWEMKMMLRSEPLWSRDDLEDSFGEVCRQRGGHLVEQQDVRFDRERARQVDDPQRGEGQVTGEVCEVEIRDPELGQPMAEWLDRASRQPQVRGDVEVGDERRFLVDRDDTGRPCRSG